MFGAPSKEQGRKPRSVDVEKWVLSRDVDMVQGGWRSVEKWVSRQVFLHRWLRRLNFILKLEKIFIRTHSRRMS